MLHMSCDMRFPTMWYMRPAKTQTSLSIPAVCSEKATLQTVYGVVKLIRRLHRLVVYTCQNATWLEITSQLIYIGSLNYEIYKS